ncbi:MAG TPA: MBL fold metallo-hydrolase [Anaeromyxobacteraceae bacterium]|nr:MBL fold metallo-hydrolase [Anaeromyxobacteraceae bacterium]
MLAVRQAVVGPFAENTWLLADTVSGEAVVVDPGGDADRVLALAGSGRVTGVVATHGHVDHVFGAAEICERTGAPFRIHAADEPFLKALPGQAAGLGFGAARAPAVAAWLVDGDEVRVGRHVGRVVHTPGHSPGGVCLHFPDDGVLLTGDTLFAGSVGRTDLPGGDVRSLLRSIRDRLFPLGDDVRFFPGHGPSGTLGEERRTNPYAGDDAPRGRFM